MPTTILNLLEYNERYHVLICKECHYAIQKSALESHLLRHRIYRGTRQQLIASIARLTLLEPDEVQLPPPGSVPVDGLPVIPGFKCNFIRCDHLCASTKRMQRHWNQSHAESTLAGPSYSPASLQTFFKGTKIKYFEVKPAVVPGDSSSLDKETTKERQSSTVAVQSEFRLEAPNHINPFSGMNLETLKYFHHFTTTASLTLPSQDRDTGHWQTDMVVRALDSRWLTCGLLAISASHLASLTDCEMTKAIHWEHSKLFLQQFTVGWEEIKREMSISAIEAAKAGAQIACIHRCYLWTLESPNLGKSIPEVIPFQLQSFMTALQGCADSNFALRSAVNGKQNFEETSTQVNNGLGVQADITAPGVEPLAMQERLRGLPYRMVEVIEKPNDPVDFFETMSALNALIACYYFGYMSDDKAVLWLAMEMWLKKVSNHFNEMIKRQSTAALIVLSHWALIVEKAEHHYWFLKGSATRIRRKIVAGLPESPEIRDVLIGLMG